MLAKRVVVFLFVVVCLYQVAEARHRSTSVPMLERQRRKIVQGCTADCGSVHPGARTRCIRKCSSMACYEEVYGGGLEDGELDEQGNAFRKCILRELKGDERGAVEEEEEGLET